MPFLFTTDFHPLACPQNLQSTRGIFPNSRFQFGHKLLGIIARFILLLGFLSPTTSTAQTANTEALFTWKIETSAERVSQFTVSYELDQKCFLHFSKFDVTKGNHEIQMHRVADLKYFDAQTGVDERTAAFALILDIDQQHIQGNTLSLTKDRNNADDTVERSFASWKIQSEIREGYRRINAVWPELGRKYVNLPRRKKVELIARDLAAMNKNASFGAFFQHNYRESYFVFGQKGYRFLPAQGFALRMDNHQKSQKLAKLLRAHRNAFCRN